MTEHIYKYWRFKGWVAKQTGRLIACEFAYQWAQDEKKLQ